jgi:hypothetical protein
MNEYPAGAVGLVRGIDPRTNANPYRDPPSEVPQGTEGYADRLIVPDLEKQGE